MNKLNFLQKKFVVNEILIKNFASTNEELEITIKIYGEEYGSKKIAFREVSKIDINSNYYGSSVNPSIIFEDLSSAQLEGIVYKIAINEDAMTFYCVKFDVL
jgi:hypothetical protein